MLVSGCEVCEDVDKLDEDPGISFPDDVEPKPPITTRFNFRLLDYYLPKPDIVGIRNDQLSSRAA